MKHLLFFLIALPSSVLLASRGNAQLVRYVWIDSPFVFSTPGYVLPGSTRCTGSSSGIASSTMKYSHIFQPQMQSSASGSSTANLECDSTASIYSQPSSSTKNLRVQVDCKDKTYDAKGDNKGWQNWSLEPSIYARAVVACVDAGYTKNDLAIDNLDFAAKTEVESVFASGKYSYEYCLIESTKNINATSKVLSGSANPLQLSFYISRLTTTLPDQCARSWQLYQKGQKNYDIHLITIFNPAMADALEYATRMSR